MQRQRQLQRKCYAKKCEFALFQTSSLLVTLRKTNVFLKLTKNVVPCVRGLAVRSSLRAILSQITMTMG